MYLDTRVSTANRWVKGDVVLTRSTSHLDFSAYIERHILHLTSGSRLIVGTPVETSYPEVAGAVEPCSEPRLLFPLAIYNYIKVQY